jgi:phage-related protein
MNDRSTTMVSGVVTPQLPVFFYRTKAGVEPTREWLKSLPEADRKMIGADLRRVQAGWPVGMPLCRSLKSGLWELRSQLPGNRIARVLFFVHGGRIGVVHGFVKKTQRTPDDVLALARKRMKEMQQ